MRALVLIAALIGSAAFAQTLPGRSSRLFAPTEGSGGAVVTATAPLVITAGDIACTAASASVGGCLTNGVQSISGSKTFVGALVQFGTTSVPTSIYGHTGAAAYEAFTYGQSGAFVGTVFLAGGGSDTGSADSAIVIGNRGSLGVGDNFLQVRNGNSFSSTLLFAVSALGVQSVPYTDQSADCDNAATGNAASGKVCIQIGQGSMVLTNSVVTANSLVHLTMVSDDTTCISPYATPGASTVTIGCAGAGTAAANTVILFKIESTGPL